MLTVLLFTVKYKSNNVCYPVKDAVKDFSGGPVVKNSPANAGDMGSIPGLGRSHILQGT